MRRPCGEAGAVKGGDFMRSVLCPRNFLTFDLVQDGRPNLTEYVYAEITATPIPPALPLLASAVCGLALLAWRRKRNA
jgi:hypothetical protein